MGHQPGAWLEEVLEAGVLHHFDVVTIHPYREDAPENFLPELPQVVDLVAQYAPPAKADMPIAVGEWGYAAGSVDGQDNLASIFARQMLLSMAFTGMPVMYVWYDHSIVLFTFGVVNII